MKKYIVFFVFIAICSGCSNFLDEKVFTQYDADVFLDTEVGINSVLAATYWDSEPTIRERWFTFAAYTADHELSRGGGYASVARTFAEFQFNSGNVFLRDHWRASYVAIRNANSLLDNIDNVTTLSADKIKGLKAEAVFLRAYNYSELYDMFGPTPIITSTLDLDFEVPRASDEEMKAFIESEYRAAANDLPIVQDVSGKATKGAALAMLGRFLLNTRQWQKAADVLQQVVDLGIYGLVTPVENLFTIENEGNNEFIFVFEQVTDRSKNAMMAHNYPVGYPTELTNWGAQLMVLRSFEATFHPSDRRNLEYDPENNKYGWMLKTYTNKAGQFIDLINDPLASDEKNHPRSFKYTPNENYATGQLYANDVCIIRYADVLLMLAEALNEINGPNQASVNLLNQIRVRAETPTFLLSDFPTKDSFRDHMLKERGWEFYTEGLRRRDLIRQNKFISGAIARGKAAQPHHVIFPIPQTELDANPALEQNPGY